MEHLNIFINDKNVPTEVISMALAIKTTLSKYFKNVEDNDIQSQAIFLDPRFKKYGFSSYDKFEACKNYLGRKLACLDVEDSNLTENVIETTSIPNVTSSSIWKNFDEQVSSVLGQNNSTVGSIIEIDKYLSENLLNRQQDPLKWWSDRKKIYPRLYEMVLRRLCVPATSVPSERVFSKAGLVLNTRRTRLTTDKIEKILFIQSNI